jgi:hypothetical protein
MGRLHNRNICKRNDRIFGGGRHRLIMSTYILSFVVIFYTNPYTHFLFFSLCNHLHIETSSRSEEILHTWLEEASMQPVFTDVHNHYLLSSPTTFNYATPPRPLVVTSSNCRDLGSQQPFRIFPCVLQLSDHDLQLYRSCIITATISRQLTFH